MKKTITSIFMVPTLKIPKDELRNNGFLNAYVEDSSKDIQYPNSVYLLFLPENIPKFREFLDDEYERTTAIIEDYDYPDEYVVVVYKLNMKWEINFDLIRQGRYSETTDNFQKLFRKVIKIKKNGLHRDELSLQYRIFNKTEDMIEYWQDKLGVEWNSDYEVWDGFNIENEILEIESILKTKVT